MTKPEGISDEAWEKAGKVFEAMLRNYLEHTGTQEQFEHDTTKVIASIIQSSVEAERLRCATVAMSFVRYGGDEQTGVTMNPMADATKIAAHCSRPNTRAPMQHC